MSCPIAANANKSNSLAYRLEEGLFSEGENTWADRVIANYKSGDLTMSSEDFVFTECVACCVSVAQYLEAETL